MARPVKEFHNYLIKDTERHVTHDDYIESPATAFLRYTLEAKDATNYCISHFNTKNDGSLYSDAKDSLQHILTAFLPAIMGHFETYQRYLFAGVFENSTLLDDFDPNYFMQKVKKKHKVEIDPKQLLAYRGQGASVGVLLADNMPGWHDPNRVNQYFKAFGFKTCFFSSDQCDRLETLWQLRHSIVHTGGTITRSDAQKVEELKQYGDKPIVFDDNFIFEVSRKMHPLVEDSTGRIEDCFRDRMASNLDNDVEERIDRLFEVKSSVHVWLK